jgi:hypothetical protein
MSKLKRVPITPVPAPVSSLRLRADAAAVLDQQPVSASQERRLEVQTSTLEGMQASARRLLVSLGVPAETLLGADASLSLSASCAAALRLACLAAGGQPEKPEVVVRVAGGDWKRVECEVRVKREGAA